jgi:hypothetical protein
MEKPTEILHGIDSKRVRGMRWPDLTSRLIPFPPVLTPSSQLDWKPSSS